MKSGFSMIELIFVIVILGIVAAVGIPKLSATYEEENLKPKNISESEKSIEDTTKNKDKSYPNIIYTAPTK